MKKQKTLLKKAPAKTPKKKAIVKSTGFAILTKKVKEEILGVHDTYWSCYLKGDVKTMTTLLAEGYSQVGSAETEVFFNKKDAVKFLRDTIKEVAGKVDMRKRVTKLEVHGDVILVHELCDLYGKADKKWVFYSKFRASTWLKQINNSWKIIHQHSSFPDARTDEGENLAIEKIEEENLQLREAVKRRTVELESKNRELEIEAALERVRARTMAMHHSAELGEVAAVLFNQISLLTKTPNRFNIGIVNEKEKSFDIWLTDQKGHSVNQRFVGYAAKSQVIASMFQAWKSKKKQRIKDLYGSQLRNWLKYMHGELGIPFDMKRVTEHRYINSIFFSHGFIGTTTNEPILPEILQILERFTKVFDQTYTRFLDLEKAEAQAREAQIETALERVRASTMGMQKSDELTEVASLLFRQIRDLGITAWTTGFNIWSEDNNSYVDYVTDPEGNFIEPYTVDTRLAPVLKAVRDAKNAGHDFFVIHEKGEAIKETYRVLMSFGEKGQYEKLLESGFQFPTQQYNHFVFGSKVSLLFITYEPVPEAHDIFKRFGKVFEQTYTRFLDLQKAEAQAREAQIEVGLERVRSRSMAMHNSEELREVIQLVFEQLVLLNFDIDSAQFDLNYKESDDLNVWTAIPGQPYPSLQRIPYTDTAIMNSVKHAKEKELNFFSHTVTFEEKNEFFKHFFKHVSNPVPEERKKYIFDKPAYARSVVFLNNIFLGIQNYSGIPYSEAENAVLMRFGKAFEQAYTRFLDLQKAETQAREAEIELALERVRSRSMAMHESYELADVAHTLYDELQKLNFNSGAATVVIMNEETGDMEHWVAGFSQKKYPECYVIKYFDHICHTTQLSAWKRKEKTLVYPLIGKERVSYTDYIFDNTGYKNFPEREKEWMRTTDPVFTMAFMKHGALMWAPNPVNEEGLEILQRFAKVFEQSYTRFLDLQKAEAQAREAQIEAALERVRARTMGMQKSEDLRHVVKGLYAQLRELGFQLGVAAITIMDSFTGDLDWWMEGFEAGYDLPEKYHVPYFDHSGHREQLGHWKKGTSYAVIEIKGAEKKTYDSYYFFQTDFAKAPENSKNLMMQQEAVIFSMAYMKYGALSWSPSQLTEEQAKILQRFAKVFEQSYTRFIDLQKAEAQTREAQIEAGLERVRSKTMAMHNSQDVGNTVASLFDELVALGLDKSARCGIGILDESNIMELWTASTNDTGELVLAIGHLNMTLHPLLKGVKKTWSSKKQTFTYELHGEDLLNYFNILNDYPDYHIYIDVKTLPEKIIHNSFYFTNGRIYCFTSNPISEDLARIFNRFAGVFGQTYKRYLDLQKAEAQTRESQIQLALERVRAKTMAMQSSNDLLSVANVLREQMGNLGQPELESSIVHLYHENSPMLEAWYAFRPPNLSSREIINGVGIVPKDCSVWSREVIANYNSPETEYTIVASGEKIKEWYKILEQYVKVTVDYDEKGQLVIPEILYYHFSKFSGGALLMISNQQPAVEARELQSRAAKVFEQAYIRFLDLKKAEAQAREAQIEAVLEKIRSRSLAMHYSYELKEVITVFFEKLNELKILLGTVGIVLFDHNKKDVFFWVGTSIQDPQLCFAPFNQTMMESENFLSDCWSSMTEKREILNKVYTKEQKDKYFEYMFANNDLIQIPKTAREVLLKMEIHTNCFFPSNQSALFVDSWDGSVYPDDSIAIIRRTGIVFEQAYTRFLDLQKAEAQAREAQIEAALERVRSRTMAMHKSEQLPETAQVLFEQFALLGKMPGRVSIGIINEELQLIEWWVTDQMGSQLNHQFTASMKEPTHEKFYAAWKAGSNSIVIDLTGPELKEWIRFVRDVVKMPIDETLIKVRRVHHAAFFSKGLLLCSANEPMTEDTMQLLVRFGKVFNQTYTRFLDLQKAEGQAREAQIEAALERVRGKAMAMHSSEDLVATIGTFYHELELFSITPRRCGVGLLDKETRMAELSTMNTIEQGQSIEVIGKMKMVGHPVLEGIFENWLLQREYHPVLRGNEIKEYYQLLRPQIAFPEYPNDAVQYGYFFYFAEGGVYAWTEKELSEDELKIYRRFTTVLSLTYKRYKDLRDAEVREKEAIKQAALDRVRADIASMRNTADLDRITPLIWKELTTLGIPFIRCGVFIMDEKENRVHTYLSAPDGRAIGAYHTPMDNSGSLAGAIDHWRQQKVFVTHWVDSDFQLQADVLLKQGSITSREQYLNTLPKEGFHLHFLPFRQGMLYVGSLEALPSEVLQLVQSLADAFSVAYARYEDFTKLESAKQQIEKTLTDLKQTQTQLIQSEKMASLGELTAGIAHEIQNPLNFVNNFSEVSTELVTELKAERLKVESERDKDLEEELLTDIFKNLEKINHHGKRAGDIVKGMLQHSRTSSGVKELTDINALADEYLRLAYHGLRAKDKSFNATMKTDFEETIGSINIIPQDIGRVILNLITNAFYAVNQQRTCLPDRQATNNESYEPTVSVSTKKEGDKILISVKDNGNGIPDSIKEKIFQPFFTTKPTGQGTGLGLSLSYDIVKAHGGELRVETKQGEGSKFIIQLPIV